VGELAVLDALGDVGIGAQAGLLVLDVALEVALEPHHLAVALEGEDVGGDAVEEEPRSWLMTSTQPGELQQRLFEVRAGC
jgi:hypothetical protein